MLLVPDKVGATRTEFTLSEPEIELELPELSMIVTLIVYEPTVEDVTVQVASEEPQPETGLTKEGRFHTKV